MPSPRPCCCARIAAPQEWIAPGGPKARDRNLFVCFREGGYFGRAFGADQVATSRHLEDYCLYTSASRMAYRDDPVQQLIRRGYNGKGFYGVIQMVNHLAQQGITRSAAGLGDGDDRHLRPPGP